MKKYILLIAAAMLMTANSIAAKEEHGNIKAGGACGMCKSRIEKAAKSVEGVTLATWDQKTQQLHVHFDDGKASVEAISKAVAKSGHDAGSIKADDATYESLPDCCKYRK
ncbi:MAG: heavy-metal-associated domain-containing protein [Tannerellaceae bacterium]|jgi:Cu(I)/Ag(I) efflux system membrane fusion protein|nr:heavy-metal-associated domain-containing protein [Tannerellaceae bacterium]